MWAPCSVDPVEQTIERATASGGEEIAFASVGDGPVLVLAAWWTSHLELDWQSAQLRDFIEALAQRHRVVRYDRPGVGLSARVERPYDIDAETDYLRTIVKATGADPVDILGISCGGPSSVRLAAEDPELVRSLVLIASYLCGSDITDDATRAALTELVRVNWGLGSQTLTNIFLPGADPSSARRFAKSQRQTTSADVAANLLDLTFTLDATPYVDQVQAPVLVLHRAHDRVIPSELGRDLAERLPAATYEELEGKAHTPWTEDFAPVLELVERFLTGQTPASTMRRLATVCFVDIVGSSDVLSEIGDRRWHQRLDEMGSMIAEEAAARGGKVVKDTGDGAMLTFDLPASALDFCQAMRGRCQAIDLHIRSGLHTGEIELRDDDITGVTVVVAARTAELAGADEILVTRTVADMVAGAGIDLVSHGTFELAGLAGDWQLMLAAPPRAGGEASTSRGPAERDRSQPSVGAQHRFGDCVLDITAFELKRAGEVVSVEPQVFDVLRYLVERPGELVSKEQLLDEVWGDRFVSESALTSRIRSARRAVGDDGQRQDVIRTVHGRGYRFVAEVH